MKKEINDFLNVVYNLFLVALIVILASMAITGKWCESNYIDMNHDAAGGVAARVTDEWFEFDLFGATVELGYAQSYHSLDGDNEGTNTNLWFDVSK